MPDARNKLNSRITNIKSIAEDILDIYFSSLQKLLNLPGNRVDYLRLNDGVVAVEEYFQKLPTWKEEHYGLPSSKIIDRHKVGALTAYYLLKHAPLVQICKGEKVFSRCGYILIANEMIVFDIALAVLKTGGRAYKCKQEMGSFIKMFLRLRKHIEGDSLTLAYTKLFVDSLSRELYLLEKLHLSQCQL